MTIRSIDVLFRDFEINGVPASGAHKPIKRDIRDTLNAGFEGGVDATTRIIHLSNTGEGTPNDIDVSASEPIPPAVYDVLFIIDVTETNTGPVTISGDIERILSTNTSQPVPPGYLQPGMAVLAVDTGTELRMLSYGDAAAVQAAAEAAQAAAEAAAASANGVTPVANRAALKLLDPATKKAAFLMENGRERTFKWLAGVVPVSDPAEGFYIASDVSGYWRRNLSGAIDPTDFGVVGDGAADDYLAFQRCITYANGKSICVDGLNIRVPTGNEIALPTLGLTLIGRGVITYEGTGNLFTAGERVKTTFNFVATAGQTVFTCAYVPTDPYVEAFVGGVKAVQAIGADAFRTVRDGTNVIVTFFTGRTVGQAIGIECERFNNATGLDPFGAVHIGTGVSIKTTRVNEGRAMAVGWIETGYVNRQASRFVMQSGSEIKGQDGTKGFKNAIWLNGMTNGICDAHIWGVGANDVTPTETKARSCPYGIFLTGELTPSDFKMQAGQTGWYDVGVAALGSTFEGLHCHGYTWLLCGKAVQWIAPVADYGLLLVINGCHANNFTGIVETSGVGSIFISDNDFFRDGTGATPFFSFIDLKGALAGSIHDNQIQSYKVGGQDVGVTLGTGTGLIRVHDNEFMAADTTGLFVGTVCEIDSYRNVIGPNSYINIGVAADIRSGADNNGLLTYGDTFQTPAVTPYARYIDAGTSTWFDKKWWIGKVNVNLAVATGSFVSWFPLEVSDPEGISSGGIPSSPAWARKVEIEAVFAFEGNATGNRWARITKAGVEMIGMQQTVPAAPSGESVVMLKGEVDCVGGEAFVAQVWQNSGVSLNILANRSYIKMLFK